MEKCGYGLLNERLVIPVMSFTIPFFRMKFGTALLVYVGHMFRLQMKYFSILPPIHLPSKETAPIRLEDAWAG